jgi:hypothetical protein
VPKMVQRAATVDAFGACAPTGLGCGRGLITPAVPAPNRSGTGASWRTMPGRLEIALTGFPRQLRAAAKIANFGDSPVRALVHDYAATASENHLLSVALNFTARSRGRGGV